jgi:acyl-CoA reductase-like NAD-dependent aldehyde dehydrogenase
MSAGGDSAAIAARNEELVHMMALEAGKPLRTARAEAARAVFTFKVAAEESTFIYGEYLPLDASDNARRF